MSRLLLWRDGFLKVSQPLLWRDGVLEVSLPLLRRDGFDYKIFVSTKRLH